MWLHGYTVQDSVPTQDYQVLELRNPMVETPPQLLHSGHLQLVLPLAHLRSAR